MNVTDHNKESMFVDVKEKKNFSNKGKLEKEKCHAT